MQNSSEDSVDINTVLTQFSVEHWAILGAGLLFLLIALVFNCWFKNRRWRAVQDARSGLLSTEFLTLRDLPKNAYEMMLEEAVKERATNVEPLWREDCGWGRPRSAFAGVHFRSFIGMSLHVLQTYALQRDSTLRVQRSSGLPSSNMDYSKSWLTCDVDEYMLRLRRAMDGELDNDLCAQYLAFFKNARISGHECTEQEFRSFLGVFQEILRRLQR